MEAHISHTHTYVSYLSSFTPFFFSLIHFHISDLIFFSESLLYLFIYWLHGTACGILVPQPGIKSVPAILALQSLNHWTYQENPDITDFQCK